MEPPTASHHLVRQLPLPISKFLLNPAQTRPPPTYARNGIRATWANGVENTWFCSNEASWRAPTVETLPLCPPSPPTHLPSQASAPLLHDILPQCSHNRPITDTSTYRQCVYDGHTVAHRAKVFTGPHGGAAGGCFACTPSASSESLLA